MPDWHYIAQRAAMTTMLCMAACFAITGVLTECRELLLIALVAMVAFMLGALVWRLPERKG